MPPVTTRLAPRKTSIMPSVVMNEGMPNRVVINPFTTPIAVATAMASSIARTTWVPAL